MSITDTFDRDGVEIITPDKTTGKTEGFPGTVIVVFSQEFENLILGMLPSEQISCMYAGRRIPVYRIEYGGKQLGFYHSLLGGAASVGLLEEIFAKGAGKVLFFGSCGSLDKNITGGHLIVPTAAYRDEETSYHYAEAGDYINIETSGRLAGIFDGLHLPYVSTRTWTTDGFYRETERNAAARKKDGCAVVEMECASVMAAGQFRKKKVYEFLYAADCLDENNWDRRILGDLPVDMQNRILKIALETALRL